MTEQEFLNKVNSGELFDEDELEKLATENCWEIDKISNGNGRWEEYMTTIFKVSNRFFAIDWEQGLTECQENFYNEQPYEVIKKEKVVTVTEWVKKVD